MLNFTESQVNENNEPEVMAESKKEMNDLSAQKVKSMDDSDELNIDPVDKVEFCYIWENINTRNNENDDDLNVNDIKTGDSKSRSKAHHCRCLPDWFEQIDENDNKIGSYLRPEEGSVSQVYCTLDNTTLSVKARGFAAIRDHIKSKKHLVGVAASDMHSSSGSFFGYCRLGLCGNRGFLCF